MLTTLTVVTFVQVTMAASGNNGPDVIQAEAAVTRIDAAMPGKETAIADSPLTLLVQRSNGGTVRLTYVPDEGWKLADRDAGLKSAEARITPAVASQQEQDAIANHPLTVFIDGPTGYTYIWIRDGGWKFVGRITDRVK
jgi:hypothetical protein